jgi:hypothetical protein
MSVTFWCPDAPYHKDDDNDFGGYSEAPEVNLSNANAAVFLDLLGLGSEWCGKIPHKDLPDMIRRCFRVSNSEARVQACTAPNFVDGNVYSTGRTDEYVVRRLNDLMMLFTYAVQNGYDVTWS